MGLAGGRSGVSDWLSSRLWPWNCRISGLNLSNQIMPLTPAPFSGELELEVVRWALMESLVGAWSTTLIRWKTHTPTDLPPSLLHHSIHDNGCPVSDTPADETSPGRPTLSSVSAICLHCCGQRLSTWDTFDKIIIITANLCKNHTPKYSITHGWSSVSNETHINPHHPPSIQPSSSIHVYLTGKMLLTN